MRIRILNIYMRSVVVSNNANALTRPKDPLRVLGEYLLQRSKELEGN
jgi:hypothetical protein